MLAYNTYLFPKNQLMEISVHIVCEKYSKIKINTVIPSRGKICSHPEGAEPRAGSAPWLLLLSYPRQGKIFSFLYSTFPEQGASSIPGCVVCERIWYLEQQNFVIQLWPLLIGNCLFYTELKEPRISAFSSVPGIHIQSTESRDPTC